MIGIPTMGMVDYRFASCMVSLSVPSMTTVMWSPRAMIDTSRNLICEKTLENPNITHLCMIDDDMTFDSDALAKLLAHDVDICGVLAFKRRPDYQPCVYRKKEDGNHYPILPEVFQEVDVVGTGMILIKIEVLKKLKFPWFTTFYDEKGVHWSVDFVFCKNAKKAGFRIFVDPSTEIGHLGDAPVITKDNFLTFVKQQNESKSN